MLLANVLVKIGAVFTVALPLVWLGGLLYHCTSGENLQVSLFKVYAVLYRAPGDPPCFPTPVLHCNGWTAMVHQQRLHPPSPLCHVVYVQDDQDLAGYYNSITICFVPGWTTNVKANKIQEIANSSENFLQNCKVSMGVCRCKGDRGDHFGCSLAHEPHLLVWPVHLCRGPGICI